MLLAPVAPTAALSRLVPRAQQGAVHLQRAFPALRADGLHRRVERRLRHRHALNRRLGTARHHFASPPVPAPTALLVDLAPGERATALHHGRAVVAAGTVQVVDAGVAQLQVVHARRRRHVLRGAHRPLYASLAAATPTARLHGRLPHAVRPALPSDHAEEALAALQRNRLVRRCLGIHHILQALGRALDGLYTSQGDVMFTALRNHS